MKDRRKEGLWNGWKGSIDEGQKEGWFMEWMEGSLDVGQKEGMFKEWMEGSMMKDRTKEGLWNGWKGSIDEGQKEGRFMEWIE